MKRPRSSLLLRLGRDQSGASAVEFAVVCIPLVLIMFGITEYGRALWTEEALQSTASSVARCAALLVTTTNNCTTVGSCGCSADATTYSASLTSTFATGQARAWGVTLQSSNSTVTVNRQASTCGVATSDAFTQVTITYNFSAVTNLLPQLQNKQLQAVACYPNA